MVQGFAPYLMFAAVGQYSSIEIRPCFFQRPIVCFPVPGCYFWHPWVSYIHLVFLLSESLLFLHTISRSEHRVLNFLEALHTALHLLRRHIVSALGVLVDVELVVLFVLAALVRSLHHVLPQDLCDRLNVLDCILGFHCAGFEIS